MRLWTLWAAGAFAAAAQIPSPAHADDIAKDLADSTAAIWINDGFDVFLDGPVLTYIAVAVEPARATSVERWWLCDLETRPPYVLVLDASTYTQTSLSDPVEIVYDLNARLISSQRIEIDEVRARMAGLRAANTFGDAVLRTARVDMLRSHIADGDFGPVIQRNTGLVRYEMQQEMMHELAGYPMGRLTFYATRAQAPDLIERLHAYAVQACDGFVS